MGRLINTVLAGMLALGGCASAPKDPWEISREIRERIAQEEDKYNAWVASIDSIPLKGERELLHAIVKYRLSEFYINNIEFEHEGQKVRVDYRLPAPYDPDPTFCRVEIQLLKDEEATTGDPLLDILESFFKYKQRGVDYDADGSIEQCARGMNYAQFDMWAGLAAKAIHKKYGKEKEKKTSD